MKLILSTAALMIALSAPAFAIGFGNTTLNTNNNANLNTNTNVNTQGQAQGQFQGQGQAQGQSSNNSNSIRNEGSVSASVGASACANGISLGAPGLGAIGGSWSSQDCRRLMGAELLYKSGALTKGELRAIVFSTNAFRGVKLQTTAKATAAAPAKLAYAKCERKPSGQLRVTLARGGDEATAVAQCKAAMK